MALRRALVVAASLVVAACGDSPQPAPPAAAAPAAPGSAAATTSGGPAPCPRTGHWTECIAFAYLEQAGLAPRRGGSADDLPSLGPAPAVYSIGTNRVAVYIFPDAAARERAAGTLDTLRFVSHGATLTPRAVGTAIQDDNLLALLFSRLEQQRERVSDVFLVGAPQP